MFDSNYECKFQNVMMTTRQWKEGDYCMAKYWQDAQVGQQGALRGRLLHGQVLAGRTGGSAGALKGRLQSVRS